MAVVCGSGDSCGVDIDTLAVEAAGTPASPAVPAGSLGGWVRGFDTFTYGPGTTCPPGTGGDTCQAVLEPLHTAGLLDTAGWRLVDDTHTATWTPQGWVQARSPGRDVQDGYLFAYGHDYAGALRTFAQLTGSAPLLPRDVFGVWYSDYHAYSSSVIQDQLYPAFEADGVPLNTLSLDTDWKAPNGWNGWEWNNTLFPQPGSFLNWARSHGVAGAHPSKAHLALFLPASCAGSRCDALI